MEDNKNLVLQSIEQLPDQCLQAWQETQSLNFPEEYKNVKNIVVCGMGGSGLPAHIIQSAFPTKVPLVLINDYRIPSWANSETLVILSSYSGDTEETLSAADKAMSKGCKITGLTTGGKLAEFLKINSYPSSVFEPTYNPSGQPRMGIGYMLSGQLDILVRLRLIEIPSWVIEEHFITMKGDMETVRAAAKDLVPKLQGRELLIFAAEHLVGNAHTFANQANETAKTYADWFAIPEANHHLLEGLKHPQLPAAAVFLDSERYSASIKIRFEITKDIVAKNNYQVELYKPSANNLLGDVLEILLFSSFLTFELAMLYNEDPVAVPWVDYFKEQLAKK